MMGDNRMKRICALAVAMMLALSCAAYAQTGTLTYVIVDGEACVTGYTGSEAVLAIPDTIEGCPVTMIAGGAFLNLTDVTDVTVSARVTYIGDAAFMGCSSLKTVQMLSANCTLGKMVFKGCDRALTISAPANSFAQTYAEDGGIAFTALELTEADTYAQALAALEAGEVDYAQSLFAGLDRYEDSRDYYIYTTARIYEIDGNDDKAIALYLIVPDTLDAMDRLTALQESEEETGGIIIGGKRSGDVQSTEQPATQDPVAPTLEADLLISFHEFIGGMPYEFDDHSKEEGMYTLYYYIDDFSQLTDYRTLFTDAGWSELDDGMDSDGWSYVYVTSPDGSASFYIAYIEAEELVVFMYDSSADYGFDPLKGL